jgi:hypothetical protein
MIWSMDGVLILLLGNVWRYSLPLSCIILRLDISFLIQGLATVHAPSSQDSSIYYMIPNLISVPSILHTILSYARFIEMELIYFIFN